MAALATKTLTRRGHRLVPALSTGCNQLREASQDATNLATYRRGRGGRSSFSGQVATVFGASGFLGKYIVNKLGKMGTQVIIPYRGEPYYVKDLKLAGDLGQILFMPYDVRDEDSLHKVMQYSNVVINLIGRDWETRNFKFEDVHVTAARNIARVARENDIERLIHFSALNASPDPKPILLKNGSQFLKSKFYGELAVLDEFPDATIFRPADIFGPEDRFIRYYANHWRRSLGGVPMWKRGRNTIKAPVFMSDVAQGVINALQDAGTKGETYECVGPYSYVLSDLVEYFFKVMRFETYLHLPLHPVFMMKLALMSRMPSYPLLSWEKLEREHTSDEVLGNLTLEDLGVNPARIEPRAQYELKPFRRHNYYEEKVGEFPDPTPPPIFAHT